MRTNARALPAAAALLFAVSAAGGSGCNKPGPNPFLQRPGEAINVIVSYDPVAKAAVMSNKTITLREGKDWAQWASPDGLVHVSFAKDSPFEAAPGHERKVLKSLPPKRGSAGHGFDYTAELELSDGSRVKVDPRIEIME
jgi:hypothetical protein